MIGESSTSTCAIGQVLGHYCIEEKIGAGAMGDVFRARDEHLDRDVAIKVLPPKTFAVESARKHFRKEALTLSKLNHPNIATIYDFDTESGIDFLVMEYIPGATLNEKLALGPLPEKDVIDLGIQLAEGITALHEYGVIHRDLKPGNLRLTNDGRLKILDFGLAMLRRPVAESATTASTGDELAGTLLYMAPEQLMGKEVDARTDIHAAGQVLYELITGRSRFSGVGHSQLITAILESTPPIMDSCSSAELRRIIGKCMEKNPENRYQSARELAIDLRRLQVGAISASPLPARRARRLLHLKSVGLGLSILLSLVLAGIAANVGGVRDRLFQKSEMPRIESLAVLPLANLSGDPEQEYFADGMTEELISNLGKIGALRVISRQSVMRYKNMKMAVPEIAHELRVDAVVEGTVLYSGGRVRITAQLIQVQPEKSLWSESYERDLRDVLSLQNDIAQGIARGVRATLTGQDRARLRNTRTIDPAAQLAYLRGRYFLNRWPKDEFNKCEGYLKEATEKAPSYAEAYAALAVCYAGMPWFQPPNLIFPKVKTAALKSLELDNNLAEGHMALGAANMFYDWDWTNAGRELKLAVELNPSNALAHAYYSNFYLFTGRFNESTDEARTAVALDPTSLVSNRNLTFNYMMSRRYDDAIIQAKATLDLDPTNFLAQLDVPWSYALKGDSEHALAEATRFRLQDRIFLVKPAKRKDGLDHIRSIVNARGYLDPFVVALEYASLDEKEEALKWLNKAYQGRSAMMVQLKVHPDLDGLRSDPRFQQLLRGINFPQ